MSRRTPAAAGQGKAPPTELPDAGGGIAPIAAPAEVPAAELVPTRVIGGGYGHQIDAVLNLAPGDAAEAVRLGWGDTRPESIAEAERLHVLHRANQGFDKRLRLHPQAGRHDAQDGSWRSPDEL